MLRLPASLTCMAKPSFGRLIRTWRTRSRRSRKEGYSSRADFALKSPYWQKMLQLVAQYDPSFDAVEYNARARAQTNATSGKLAQNNNALNTGIGHVWQLARRSTRCTMANGDRLMRSRIGGARSSAELPRRTLKPFEIVSRRRSLRSGAERGAQIGHQARHRDTVGRQKSCAALWRSRGNRRPYGIEDRSQRSAVRKYHGADGQQAPK